MNSIILTARASVPGEEDYVVPLTKNPSQTEVQSLLEPIKGNSDASATMRHGGELNVEKPTLRLRVENGRYLLTLAEFDADGDYQVRTLTNPNSTDGNGLMHGEYFGASNIVEDFDLVLRAFCEFARTGNVSHDLMD